MKFIPDLLRVNGMFNRIGSFLLTALVSCSVYAADPSGLTVSGAFTYSSVGDGNVNTLTLTLSNATGETASNIGFVATIADTGNLDFAVPLNVVTSCGDGSYSSNDSALTASGYTLADSSSCTFAFDMKGVVIDAAATVLDVNITELNDMGRIAYKRDNVITRKKKSISLKPEGLNRYNATSCNFKYASRRIIHHEL